MDNWDARLKTYSRDDLMKVCAILARGIGKERVSSENIQVNIQGTARGGKSAIMDGLSAAFIDGRTPYKLPTIPLMEDFSCQALHMDIKKVFPVHGKETLFTFSRDDFVRHRDLPKHSRMKLHYRFGGASGRGLDFITTSYEKNSRADLFIRLQALTPQDTFLDDGWLRNWNIEIRSRRLKTPEMAEALQDLRNFHERRQARISSVNLSSSLDKY